MTTTPDRPEPVVLDRQASSPAVLAQGLRAFGEAWRLRDEHVIRAEARSLSREFALIAARSPLFPSDDELPDVRVRQSVYGNARMGKV